ncbi:hypothetical protein LOTGIDRAFT_158395 [Lottia gigantea]|uniref:Uncharacterized protein n=1 Tax=Lottia gigantea TaxID=225164 RepID=V4CBR1_LOTGI|nr:hypothetical protein LOTGIDRAFT_158395 [Lottia gigantea]ESO99314.1 hypothetical protein LOTGIDRAFT_158395 [Lottia gigantea]
MKSCAKIIGEEPKIDVFSTVSEIGPRPVLRAHLPNFFTDQVLFDSIPIMKKNDEVDCVSEAVCNFYGLDLKWTHFDDFKANVSEYPKYQFNRVDNLLLPTSGKEKLLGVDQASKYHPFVKQLVSDTKDIKILIDPSKLSSIYEHKVNGLVVIPGALYAEVGLALAALKSPSISFREVTHLQSRIKAARYYNRRTW